MDTYCNDFKKTVSRWSVSLRYQLVHRYNVSNWSGFFHVTLKHGRNVSNRSDQLGRFDNVSAWFSALKSVTKMGQFLLGVKAVHFLQTSGGSASLRYQLVRCYNISKTWVSFSYQSRPICNVLSQSVSLRYQIGWFHLPANETSQIRHKQACLIHVQVARSC